MTIRAIYPPTVLMEKIKQHGVFNRVFDRELYAKLQMAVDTGADRVMLSGAEYEYFVSMTIENKPEEGGLRSE